MTALPWNRGYKLMFQFQPVEWKREKGNEKGYWVSPPAGTATKSPQKRDQRQKPQELFLGAPVQDWSQQCCCGTLATQGILPLLAAGSRAAWTLWGLVADLRRVWRRQQGSALVRGLSQRPVGVAFWASAVGCYIPFFIATRTTVWLWQPCSQHLWMNPVWSKPIMAVAMPLDLWLV